MLFVSRQHKKFYESYIEKYSDLLRKNPELDAFIYIIGLTSETRTDVTEILSFKEDGFSYKVNIVDRMAKIREETDEKEIIRFALDMLAGGCITGYDLPKTLVSGNDVILNPSSVLDRAKMHMDRERDIRCDCISETFSSKWALYYLEAVKIKFKDSLQIVYGLGIKCIERN